MYLKVLRQKKVTKESLKQVLKKWEDLTGYRPKERKPNVWRGICPYHSDRVPSLYLEVKNGRLHFNCLAKCPEEKIWQALGLDFENSDRSSQTKEAIVIKIFKELERGNYSFWKSQYDEPYISVSQTQHLRIGSREFREYFQVWALKREGKTLHSQAMQELIELCSCKANESNKRKHVFLRAGYKKNFIEINLMRKDGKVLRILPNNILLDFPKLKFQRLKTMLPLRLPSTLVDINTREDWKLFFKIFNLKTKEDLALVVAFMLKTFYPIGEYPILAIIGQREAVGKTTMARMIAQLIDPTISPIKTLPKDVNDLYSLAKNSFLLVFDNLSNITDTMSDALCQLSTGGSLSKRKLYTDADAIDYPLKNPIILTSIDNVLKRRDLRRRTLVVELEKPEKIIPQRELEKRFEELQPKLFGYLCLCIQEALKEKKIDLDFPDLADFCEWIAKASPCFFMTGKEFVSMLNENRKQVAMEIIEGNLIVSLLQKKLEASEIYEVTASQMLEDLKKECGDQKGLPKDARTLGKEVKRLASDLEAIGIKTNFCRTKKGRKLIFTKLEEIQENQKVVNQVTLNRLTSPSYHPSCQPSIQEIMLNRKEGDVGDVKFLLKTKQKEEREEEVKDKSEKVRNFNVINVTSFENKGNQALLDDVKDDFENFDVIFNVTPQVQDSFWIIKVEREVCPKCGCDDYRIDTNPEERKGTFVFARCLNCDSKKMIKLRDFEVLWYVKNEKILSLNRPCVICKSDTWIRLSKNKTSAIKCKNCNHVELEFFDE